MGVKIIGLNMLNPRWHGISKPTMYFLDTGFEHCSSGGSDDGNISWEEFEELEKCPRRMIGKCLKGGRWGGCVSYWDTVITSKRWVGKWREDIVDVIVYDDAPSGTGPRKRAE